MSHYPTYTPIAPGRRGSCWHAATALLVLLVGCGRQGAPTPPLRLTPQPLADLRLAQRGERVTVAYSVPNASVDGQRLPVVTVELLWTSQEGDLQQIAERRMRKAAPGERLVDVLAPLFPRGTTVRVAGRAHATRRTSALSPEATLQVRSAPPVPVGLSVRRTRDDVLLSWTAPPAAPCPPATSAADTGTDACPSMGYFVYRRSQREREPRQIVEAPVTTLDFHDATAAPGTGWCYSVTSLTSVAPVIESDPLKEVCISASTESTGAISSPGVPETAAESQASPAPTP